MKKKGWDSGLIASNRELARTKIKSNKVYRANILLFQLIVIYALFLCIYSISLIPREQLHPIPKAELQLLRAFFLRSPIVPFFMSAERT